MTVATRKKAEEAEIETNATEDETAAEEKVEMSLSDVQAEIAKMLDAAKAEARKIVEEAKAAGAAAPAKTGAAYKPAITEERVTIQLFKDRGQYAGDKFVGVNGIGYQIKRGVPVEVPKSVAEVLAQSEAQDASTALMIDEKVLEYENSKN